MKHFVVVERTDKHGSRNGEPTLQFVSGKGAALDLIYFAADSPNGVHVWWFRSEEAARTFYNNKRAEGRVTI